VLNDLGRKVMSAIRKLSSWLMLACLLPFDLGSCDKAVCCRLDPVADPVVLTPAGAGRRQLTSHVGNGVIRVSRCCAKEGLC
jgi:hypothetical protein